MRDVYIEKDGVKQRFTQARLALYSLFNHAASIPPHLELAVELVKRRYVRILERYPKTHPLTEATSLNGLDGVRFVDKIKQKTGSGLPLRGPKTDLLIGGTPECLSYTAVGRKSVQFVADELMAGNNPGIVFDLQYKDEVKKAEKPIRTFAACPAVYNELMRRGFLQSVKYLQENYLLSGISIGVDCKSKQWGNIHDKHLHFPHHFLFDFAKFDKSHSSEVLRAACSVLLSCMATVFLPDSTICGYPVLPLMAAGMSLLCTPIYVFFDSVFMVTASLASGLFLTAHINSIIQELYLTCAWIEFWGKHRVEEEMSKGVDSFLGRCCKDSLGDDGMVSTLEPGFNLAFFSRFCSTFGVVVTAPDKTTNFPDNFPVQSWNFLKRGFLPKDGVVWAPIEEESILKNLNWKKKTANLTDEQAHFEFVVAGLQECAAAGDDRFKSLYAQTVKAFHEAFPSSGRIFPTFEQERQTQLKAYQKDKDSPAALWKRAGQDSFNYWLAFCRVEKT
jgi:hypothetical protein